MGCRSVGGEGRQISKRFDPVDPRRQQLPENLQTFLFLYSGLLSSSRFFIAAVQFFYTLLSFPEGRIITAERNIDKEMEGRQPSDDVSLPLFFYSDGYTTVKWSC